MRAQQLTEPLAHHGEGPVWDAAAGRLRWVDLLAGDVLATDPDGRTEREHVATVAACVVPRSNGGVVVATERGFVLLGPDGGVLQDVWDDPSVRMNDGGCDPLGRFFCGTMAYAATPGRGTLFRLDPDRTVHTVLTGVTISNGLGWSPDGSVAYYVDSATHGVDACSPDLTERSAFVSIPADDGIPDGLAVDAEGGVWVALWGGGQVRRYDCDGRLDQVVDLPVRQVSSCAFGGEGLRTLYVTTSREGLADPEPTAGALFAAEVGVAGLPAAAFAG